MDTIALMQGKNGFTNSYIGCVPINQRKEKRTDGLFKRYDCLSQGHGPFA